ncbi:hypothetical protein Q7689_13950, partial [Nocardiopsis tropica]|nr:hypothetical protein [Nocardiopsis tropica]
GRFSGHAVVLDPGLRHDLPAPRVLTADKQVKRVNASDCTVPGHPSGRMRIPKSFSAKSPRSRQDLASTLRNKLKERGTDPVYERGGRDAGEDAEVRRLRTALREHPCHGCADREDHARWAERYFRLSRETDSLRRRVEGRSHVISRTFDRVCGVLEDLEYLSGDSVSDDGSRLAKIYSELDLLVAECLRRGVWKGLNPVELAACVASLVYEARRNDDAYPRVPSGPVETTLAEMVRLWGELNEVEARHRVSFLRQPDLGFVWTAHRWARGDRLDDILRQADMPAGDFVRTAKMLVDMLSQIAGATGDAEVRSTSRKAADLVRRGVVADSSFNSARSARRPVRGGRPPRGTPAVAGAFVALRDPGGRSRSRPGPSWETHGTPDTGACSSQDT